MSGSPYLLGGGVMEFPARNELAWEWRYCEAWMASARFNVLFDTGSGLVRSTLSVREVCGESNCGCSPSR